MILKFHNTTALIIFIDVLVVFALHCFIFAAHKILSALMRLKVPSWRSVQQSLKYSALNGLEAETELFLAALIAACEYVRVRLNESRSH
jgi:hypothetical protein